MSVVYKGMDTSLNREVAVKVLHPHLASADEARERFEREAHAVAKLRHENILEIFDYSGKNSTDSYIVTEFIRGRTLRTIIAEHQLAFPEVAAMVVVEVCRALAHAHSLGVLHRDIKPENIMIRDDGTLKLMDFGIAQIVDSHRMTVTGQLLGSPAYMSPEHIEGRPLDFRTDVFSVGTLLYQLSTGELPFKGRNPHEILKRIAECRYLDARVVNPLVADRLNRIIGRALARLPDDRYADVSLMLDDLTRFCAEVELADPRLELGRFFTNPLPYEQALRQRLLSVLKRRGKEELDAKRTARALEMWNRVLTIDPANDEILRAIDRLSRRQRIRWGLLAGLGLLAASGGVALAWQQMVATEKESRAASPSAPPVPVAESKPIKEAPPPKEDPPPAPGPVAAAMAAIDAGITAVPTSTPRAAHVSPRDPPARPQAPQAPREFHLVTTPKNAFYSVDGGELVQISMGSADVTLSPGAHKILFRHPLCEDRTERVDASDAGGGKFVRLPWKPTRVRARCEPAGGININGKPVHSGDQVEIAGNDFSSSGKAQVVVDFLIEGRAVEIKPVTVTAGDPVKEVTCDGG